MWGNVVKDGKTFVSWSKSPSWGSRPGLGQLASLAHPVRLAPHPGHLLDRHVEEGGQLLVVVDRHLGAVISGMFICR